MQFYIAKSRHPTEQVSFEIGFVPVLKSLPYCLANTRMWERKGENGSLSSQEGENLCNVAGSVNAQEEVSF